MRPSVLWHHARLRDIARGRSHGLRAAGRRGGAKDVGEGSITLAITTPRAIATLIVLVTSHCVVLEDDFHVSLECSMIRGGVGPGSLSHFIPPDSHLDGAKSDGLVHHRHFGKCILRRRTLCLGSL